MKDHFRALACYNAWANRLTYDAAGNLGDADYRADKGAFFGSVHGTLNHLLVADRIWMKRFTGEGEAPARLDHILFEALADLRHARRAEDARIVGYVDGLADADLAGTIRYRRVTTPDEIVQALAPALAHFFNHQTHHRGQVHAMLTALGGRDFAPSLDLLEYQQAAERGVA